jgi:preprotein translocase subunit SecA
MNNAMTGRLVNLIPNVALQAIEREEAELRKVQQNAQLIGGSDVSGEGIESERGRFWNFSRPVKTAPKIGRNDMVTITNGTETQELKFKKAELLIASGEWKLVA